jgi:type I restriction enzyme S subunit
MVEWKKLGEVCAFNRGRTITAKDAVDGDIPVIAGGQTPSYYHNEANRDGESITVAGSGAYAGFVSYWNQPIFVSDAFTVDPIDFLKHKYLFHWLKMNQKRMFETQKGAGVPHVHGKDIANFLLPIPSLEEQTRIVGILDTFTSAIDNLKEQIAQRRKQYEYYRDQLLDLEKREGVEMKTLGDIGKCVAGATPSTKVSEYWDGGNIPWMSSGEVHQKNVTHTTNFITKKGYENASTKMLPVGTIVIALAGQGKTRGSVAITAIELCTNKSLCGVIISDVKIVNKFIYYYMSTRYDDLRRISSGDGTRGGLNLKMISSYLVPIPPLSEQQSIVSILDTFEVSIQNLEAQLKEREKQYEYYRNKLLTFE